VIRKASGLTAATVRRPMVGSGTSLLGLIKHLTRVEIVWFQYAFAGADVRVPGDDLADDDEPQSVIDDCQMAVTVKASGSGPSYKSTREYSQRQMRIDTLSAAMHKHTARQTDRGGAQHVCPTANDEDLSMTARSPAVRHECRLKTDYHKSCPCAWPRCLPTRHGRGSKPVVEDLTIAGTVLQINDKQVGRQPGPRQRTVHEIEVVVHRYATRPGCHAGKRTRPAGPPGARRPNPGGRHAEVPRR